jgi:hypothetical protein
LRPRGDLSVSFFQPALDMVSDSDVPLLPARWHSLIIDGAERRAWENAGQFDRAEVAAKRWQAGVEELRQAVVTQGRPSPKRESYDHLAPPRPAEERWARRGEKP